MRPAEIANPTNPFVKHGMKHLSPSTINLWITQPSLCLLKIAGITDEAGPAAWRGNAVDRAGSIVAFNPTMPEEVLMKGAYEVFDNQRAKSIEDIPEAKIAKERENLPRYIKNTIEFYVGLKVKPIKQQEKVSVMLGDIPIPFIGFYDLLYKNEVRDTKSVGKMPSAPSTGHSRQAALYAHATGCEPWLDYIGVNGYKTFHVEDHEKWLEDLYNGAKSLEKMLASQDNILDCCRMTYPDLDHWMWSDTTRQAARDVWVG